MSINKITISFQMDNEAFDEDKWLEASRILDTIAMNLRHGRLPVSLVDINGNTCGTVVYDEVKP